MTACFPASSAVKAVAAASRAARHAVRAPLASSNSRQVVGVPALVWPTRGLRTSAPALRDSPKHEVAHEDETAAEYEDGGPPGGLFSRPGPPPLPPKEQREFEKLVREKANAPQFQPASAMGDEKHPQYRAKPRPEFEGEENPQTGEVGGPKNDPLRWEREWTYGGRSTESVNCMQGMEARAPATRTGHSALTLPDLPHLNICPPHRSF